MDIKPIKSTARKNEDTIRRVQDIVYPEKVTMINLFLPVAKLSSNSKLLKEFVDNNHVLKRETEFGVVELRNRLLTENHYRVVSSIVKNSKLNIGTNGAVIAEFEELVILRDLELGEKNYQLLRRLVSEIADAGFYFEIGSGLKKRMQIFTDHILPTKERSRLKKQAVVIHPAYFDMLRDDFAIQFEGLYKKINNINIPTIPTIIRYLFYKNRETNETQFTLKQVLHAINYPQGSYKTIRTMKERIQGFKEQLEDDYKIIYIPEDEIFDLTNIKDLELKNIKLLEFSIEELNSYIGKKFIDTKDNNKEYTITAISNLDNLNNRWIIKAKRKIHDEEIEREFEITIFLNDLKDLLSKFNQ